MDKEQKQIKQLESWLKKDGNTKAGLADLMGYTSSVAIDMWIKRRRIPTYQLSKLKEIFTQ